MISLYITSTETLSGKTALCAGLLTKLAASGRKAGYFKPVLTPASNVPADTPDSDVLFIKQVFHLEEPVEILCPVFRNLREMTANIQQAFIKASSGKDAMIIEGPSEFYPVSGELAEKLNARVLMVEKYSREPLQTAGYKQFAQSLPGVVLNKVPLKKMEQARKETSEILEKAGIKLLGMLPEDRSLLGISIGELAEYTHGNIVSGAEQADELIENLVVTTTGLDPGAEYYNRKANKALIFTRAPRYRHPSASRSPSKCAVLTGPASANQTLIDEFKGKNIPVIVTEELVSTIETILENAMAKARFNQIKKMPRLTEMLEHKLDFGTLYEQLGITG